MWIRKEEDLRAHLEDPASREGHAVDYKKDVSQNKTKGLAADIVETVCAMSNADGGQVLVGVDETGGAPTTVCGVANADDAQKWIEAAMDSVLRLAEPRPRVWVLEFDGRSVVIVDVFASVRLAALWRPGERNKIMYPVRTGQGTDYMRPGDVEARILTYGPRAQRIVLEQLLREAETTEITVYSSNRHHTPQGPGRVVIQLWHHGPTNIEEIAPFGIRLAVTHESMKESAECWIPYDWITPFLTRQGWRARAGPLESDRVGLVLRATLLPPGNGTKIKLNPPPG